MSFLIRSDSDSKKLKSLLKISLERIKISKSKRCTLARQSRNDTAQLLMKGQYEKAESRVEYVFREENTVAAYEQLEGFCQQLLDRADSLKTNKECPSDLKGVIGALFYAAPRCGDLPELHDCRNLLKSKFGDGFVLANMENKPESGTNKIMELLSSRTPSRDTKLNLLKQIALEHNIEWTWNMVASGSSKKSNSSMKPKEVPIAVNKSDSMEHSNQNPVDEMKTPEKNSMKTRAIPSSPQADTREAKTNSESKLPLSSSNKHSIEEITDHRRMSDDTKMASARIIGQDQFTRPRQKVLKDVSDDHEGKGSNSIEEITDHRRMSDDAKMANARIIGQDQLTRPRQNVLKDVSDDHEGKGSSFHSLSSDVKNDRDILKDSHLRRMSNNEYAETKTRSKTRSKLLDLQAAAEAASRSAAEAAEAADLAYSLIRFNSKKKMNPLSASRLEKATSQDQKSEDGMHDFVTHPNRASASRPEKATSQDQSSRDGMHEFVTHPNRGSAYQSEKATSQDQRSGDGTPEFVLTHPNRVSSRSDQNMQKKSFSRAENSDENPSLLRDMRFVVNADEVKHVVYQEAKLSQPLPKYDESDDEEGEEEEMATYVKRNSATIYDHYRQNMPLSYEGNGRKGKTHESSHQQIRKLRQNNLKEEELSIPYAGYAQDRFTKATHRQSAGPHDNHQHERAENAKLGINEQDGKSPNWHLPDYVDDDDDRGQRLYEESTHKRSDNKVPIHMSGRSRQTTYEQAKGRTGYVAKVIGESYAEGKIRQQVEGPSYDNAPEARYSENPKEQNQNFAISRRTKRSSKLHDTGGYGVS